MKHLLSWIVGIPVTVVVVVFSIANRDWVTVDFWPLEMSRSLPLFVLILGSFLAGFLVGAVIMWLSSGRTRDKARENYYKASHLERELAAVRRKQAQHATASPPGLPAAR